jgi:hypothetical protein
VTLAPVPGGPALPAATLSDVSITAAWGLWISADTMPHGPVTLRRVTASGTLLGAWISGRVDVTGEQVTMQATNTSEKVSVGYGTGLKLSGQKGVPAVALRHATIARIADRGTAVDIYHTLDGPMPLDLRDSLILAVGARSRAFSLHSSPGTAIVSLDHSAWRASGVYFPYAAEANARLELGTGNVDLDRSPALVPNAGAGDLRPAAGSALIDNGSPVAGESPFDVLGGARVVDGDRDGSAVRDIGAVEAAPETNPTHVAPVLHEKPETTPPPPPPLGDRGDDPPAVPVTLSALKARRAPRGVSVSFRSSAGGAVKLRLERCVTWRARSGCTRLRRVAARTVAAKPGTNRTRIGSKRLQRGRYRVSVQLVASPTQHRSVPLHIRHR